MHPNRNAIERGIKCMLIGVFLQPNDDLQFCDDHNYNENDESERSNNNQSDSPTTSFPSVPPRKRITAMECCAETAVEYEDDKRAAIHDNGSSTTLVIKYFVKKKALLRSETAHSGRIARH